jgi:hypothetical protein
MYKFYDIFSITIGYNIDTLGTYPILLNLGID